MPQDYFRALRDVALAINASLDPKDGALIKVCDRLAAFMEAHSSIRNGVSASSMQEACIGLGKDLRSSPLSAVLGLEALLADFD